MSFADERTAIEARFAANFSANPVKYENVPFDQPDAASWVALTILPGDAIPVSIGTARRVERHSGIIQIDVYTVEDGGTKAARTLADSVAGVFRNVQFSSGNSGTISTGAPSLTTLGVAEGWFHLVVSVTYHRDFIV